VKSGSLLAALLANVVLAVAVVTSIYLAAGRGDNRDRFARHPRTGMMLAMAITFGHLLIFRQRYESMRRPHHVLTAIELSSALS